MNEKGAFFIPILIGLIIAAAAGTGYYVGTGEVPFISSEQLAKASGDPLPEINTRGIESVDADLGVDIMDIITNSNQAVKFRLDGGEYTAFPYNKPIWFNYDRENENSFALKRDKEILAEIEVTYVKGTGGITGCTPDDPEDYWDLSTGQITGDADCWARVNHVGVGEHFIPVQDEDYDNPEEQKLTNINKTFEVNENALYIVLGYSETISNPGYRADWETNGFWVVLNNDTAAALLKKTDAERKGLTADTLKNMVDVSKNLNQNQAYAKRATINLTLFPASTEPKNIAVYRKTDEGAWKKLDLTKTFLEDPSNKFVFKKCEKLEAEKDLKSSGCSIELAAGQAYNIGYKWGGTAEIGSTEFSPLENGKAYPYWSGEFLALEGSTHDLKLYSFNGGEGVLPLERINEVLDKVKAETGVELSTAELIAKESGEKALLTVYLTATANKNKKEDGWTEDNLLFRQAGDKKFPVIDGLGNQVKRFEAPEDGKKVMGLSKSADGSIVYVLNADPYDGYSIELDLSKYGGQTYQAVLPFITAKDLVSGGVAK